MSWASFLCHCNKENVFHVERLSCPFQNLSIACVSAVPVVLKSVCLCIRQRRGISDCIPRKCVHEGSVRVTYPRERTVLKSKARCLPAALCVVWL